MTGDHASRPAAVFRPKPHALGAIFGRRKVVIGVIHLHALPGSPDYDGAPMHDLLDFALAEAGRYAGGGVDGLIVENHGDIPFAKPDKIGPETVACMAVITDAVRRASGLPLGVNVLANGALAALAMSPMRASSRDRRARRRATAPGYTDGASGSSPMSM
jgi:predicted TIM-barrel enzyme